jgi:hypothetical protein
MRQTCDELSDKRTDGRTAGRTDTLTDFSSVLTFWVHKNILEWFLLMNKKPYHTISYVLEVVAIGL